MPFLNFTFVFCWEGEPPTKIDYRKKGTLILTSLLENLLVYIYIYTYICVLFCVEGLHGCPRCFSSFYFFRAACRGRVGRVDGYGSGRVTFLFLMIWVGGSARHPPPSFGIGFKGSQKENSSENTDLVGLPYFETYPYEALGSGWKGSPSQGAFRGIRYACQ